MASNFQNVSKDMCVKEFMALKDCYVVIMQPLPPIASWVQILMY